MGIVHQTKFSPGDRINDSFTLIEDECTKTNIPGKNKWRWKCKCDCGNIFYSRECDLGGRYGCQSCTNRKTRMEYLNLIGKNIDHIGLKNRLLKEYKAGAVKRKLPFELTFDQFIDLMEGPCFYCGAPPKIYKYQLNYMQKNKPIWAHNGIDRVDSSKGYTLDNCVSCCTACNYAKHEMSVEEYKEFIKRVYDHLIIEGSSTIPEGSTSEAIADGNGTHLEKDEDIVKSV